MNKLRAAVVQGKRSAKRRIAMTADLLGQRWRRSLTSLGIPVARPHLTLRGSDRSDYCGLFSEFAAVLGLLDHYEARREMYAGVNVDFADQGLYYDPAFGENWWQYYFEPIALGNRANALPKIVDSVQHEQFACAIDRLPRARGAELIAQHIRPKPCIGDKLDSYVRENFGDACVIGVHYRGTDKHEEAPRVPYERVQAAVLHTLGTAGGRPHKLFVATDEQAFLDFMHDRFGGAVLYREMFRSVDGQPTHWRNESNHAKGQDAVLDCLLLSKCDALVRTTSNLGLCSTLFNPRMPTVLLNQRQ